MDAVLPVREPVRPGRALPAWESVLAVVAHPDDESWTGPAELAARAVAKAAGCGG